MYCMTPTCYDLRAWGRLIKTIFKNFPNIYTYLGTNLRYIPVVISKSAHPIAHRRIPIWPPVMSAVNTGRSLSDTVESWAQNHWNPGHSYPTAAGVCSADVGAWETLASGAPTLSHWNISIGCCYEGSLLLVQCQLISINKLESGKEQCQSKWETILWSKMETLEIHRS
jgi:hypothetical protein